MSARCALLHLHVMMAVLATSTFEDNADNTIYLLRRQQGCNQSPSPRFMYWEARQIDSVIQHFRILPQITLALKLAEAVLQYHLTLWLPQAWTSHDVACFTGTAQPDTSDICEVLDSLHLSNRFTDREPYESKAEQVSLDLGIPMTFEILSWLNLVLYC